LGDRTCARDVPRARLRVLAPELAQRWQQRERRSAQALRLQVPMPRVRVPPRELVVVHRRPKALLPKGLRRELTKFGFLIDRLS